MHVGMEVAQVKDFPATSTQEDFTKNLKLLPTSPELRAGRKNPLSMDYIKLRPCKLGELRWVAAVPRPDICARLARINSRINALCGSHVYRFRELVRMVKNWQQAAAFKYASPSHPWEALGWGHEANWPLRGRGARVHGGSTTLFGWSNAAYGGRSTEGTCRLGFLIGMMSPTLKGQRHISQRSSKFSRKIVKSSLGGEVYALSGMADHMLLLGGFWGPLKA